MASYEEIHGKRVETFSSDPTLDSSYEGQVWFNSTDGVLKSVVASAAWRSGTPISTSGYGAAGSCSLTAGLIMGRNTLASGDTPSNATEEWNGSGWTTGGNLSTARYYGGALGTQTATVFVGGDSRPPGSGSQTTSENYNGTSWTSGTAYPVAVTLASGFGTTSAGVMCNGSDTTYSSTTKEYDGSWTAGGSLSTARRWIGTAGTQTAGLAFGGQVPPSGHSTNVTEEYGGTSWTSGGSLNATRAVNAVGGGINQDASQTNALASGGYQSSGSPKTYFNETEAYDGTSWSAQPTMTTARGYGTGGGTGSAGIVVGAYTGSLTTAVEEFDNTVNTITAAAWSSGGNLNTGRQDVGGTGTKSAGLAMGGRTGSSGPFTQANNSEEYDGTSWTEGNNLNTARGEGSGAGTQTAAVYFGGAPDSNATENYNGTSWTTSPGTLNTGRSSGASFGASYTSAVFCGGYGGARIANVEEWNGSAWTNATALPEARYNAGGAGIESAGIVLGGSNAPGGTVTFATSVEYNGSSWTAGGTNTAALEGQGMNGTQTACISYGGPTSLTANSSTYDGTTFVTSPNMAANRSALGASKGASITNTMGFGGSTPPNRQMNNTEEFTSEVETANVTDFTTS